MNSETSTIDKNQKVICLLQARMSSSRLPNKVLMPISGIPLVVLSSKRAANTGLDVRVVTSTEPSDDILETTLREHGICCFRGSLQNTLERFSCAIKEEHDTSIIVRLTGDNLLPDGTFIEGVVRYFIDNKLNYLGTTGEATGLPYGLSVEVFRVKDVREAHQKADSDYSKEHVTPDIIKMYGERLYKDKCDIALSYLRATVDTHDDYVWMSSLFNDIEFPITVSYRELCGKLENQFKHKQLNKLVIGCAQLGLDYGITNIVGKPSKENARKLITLAKELNIGSYDTAQAYGNSESVIASLVAKEDKVVSKLFPYRAEDISILSPELIKEKVLESLEKFSDNPFDILLHRAEHLWLKNGKVWSVLTGLKKQGKVGKIGVSVQSPNELIKALNTSSLDIIQLPFNILDIRWKESISLLQSYKQKYGAEVHVRSVFLQGLLLSESAELWKKAGVGLEMFAHVVEWLKHLTKQYQLHSIKDLLIRYVASQHWCDKLVIGMQNENELKEAVRFISLPPLTDNQLSRIELSIPRINEQSLNPATWKEN